MGTNVFENLEIYLNHELGMLSRNKQRYDLYF